MVSCFSQACKLFPFFIQRNFRDRMTIDDTRRILSERRSSVSSLARAYKLAFHVFYIDLPPYTLVTARDIHAVYIYCSAFELIKEACKLPPPRLFHRGTVILEDVDFFLYERVISLGSINHDVLRRACRLAFHDRFLLSLRPKYIGAILIFWKAGYACAMTLV